MGKKQRYNESKDNYRALRTTIVLALNSAEIASKQTPELEAALAAAQEVNFDFASMDTDHLEEIYAAFDDKFTKRVLKEYEFIPCEQSVTVHNKCEAICNLCGKGDSLETGDNRDKIRIEFRLSNHAGGNEVWCGSTCIKNHGLKVKGAATAAQASKILDRAMRSAVRLWDIQEWQAAHPDHTLIPDQYQQLRRLVNFANDAVTNHFAECVLAGVDIDIVAGSLPRVVNAFQVTSKFYTREGYLTELKHGAWSAAKEALGDLVSAQKLFAEADGKDPSKRFKFFEKAGAENNGKAAA